MRSIVVSAIAGRVSMYACRSNMVEVIIRKDKYRDIDEVMKGADFATCSNNHENLTKSSSLPRGKQVRMRVCKYVYAVQVNLRLTSATCSGRYNMLAPPFP